MKHALTVPVELRRRSYTGLKASGDRMRAPRTMDAVKRKP